MSGRATKDIHVAIHSMSVVVPAHTCIIKLVRILVVILIY